MHTRIKALNTWLKSYFSHDNFSLHPLAGDASFRSYWRVISHHKAYVLMDAPPDKESIKDFIKVTTYFQGYHIRVPHIFKSDAELGLIILEDFGDELLLKKLTTLNADFFYKKALSLLQSMQLNCALKKSAWHVFDEKMLINEWEIFEAWFLNGLCKLTLSMSDEMMLKKARSYIFNVFLNQPQTIVHKDFHSRNLMVLQNDELGMIDYQDALIGPVTYDLVSLLKDCYIKWPQNIIDNLSLYFYKNSHFQSEMNHEAFQTNFLICGLQRHLKVLGVFSRLHIRDGKSNYLNDLPLTFEYILNALVGISELEPLHDFMRNRVFPKFKQVHSCLAQ